LRNNTEGQWTGDDGRRVVDGANWYHGWGSYNAVANETWHGDTETRRVWYRDRQRVILAGCCASGAAANTPNTAAIEELMRRGQCAGCGDGWQG